MTRRPEAEEFRDKRAIAALRVAGEWGSVGVSRVARHIWDVWGFLFLLYGILCALVLGLCIVMDRNGEHGRNLLDLCLIGGVALAIALLVLRPWIIARWRGRHDQNVPSVTQAPVEFERGAKFMKLFCSVALVMLAGIYAMGQMWPGEAFAAPAQWITAALIPVTFYYNVWLGKAWDAPKRD